MTLLLGEEVGDPGVVDEVASSAESAKDDQVKEDTKNLSQLRIFRPMWGSKRGEWVAREV
jgi:hypothetical protein